MSATTGMGELATICFSALASSLSKTAQRTMSQPAKYSLCICSSVPFTSFVFENVIDCTEIGASPPIKTSRIFICFVGYRCKILPLNFPKIIVKIYFCFDELDLFTIKFKISFLVAFKSYFNALSSTLLRYSSILLLVRSPFFSNIKSSILEFISAE